MVRSLSFLALFMLSASYADERELKDEAHFRCTVAAGQYWPGDKTSESPADNLFIKTKPFRYDYKVAKKSVINITLADFTTRFNGGKELPFIQEMARGYDLEIPFEVSLLFSNSLKLETSISWKLPDYGVQPLVLMESAIIEKGLVEAKHSFVLPHKDSEPKSTPSAVQINVRCQEI